MINESNNDTSPLIKKVDLASFIKENQSIIAVFGVFIALSAFFINQNESFPSAISLLLAIVVAFELWIKFPPNEKASMRLKIFEFLFYPLLLYMTIKILSEYEDFVISFSFFILLIPLGYINLKCIEKFEFFKYIRSLTPSNSTKSEIIRGIFAFLLFSPAFIISFLLSKVILWLFSNYIGN